MATGQHPPLFSSGESESTIKTRNRYSIIFKSVHPGGRGRRGGVRYNRITRRDPRLLLNTFFGPSDK